MFQGGGVGVSFTPFQNPAGDGFGLFPNEGHEVDAEVEAARVSMSGKGKSEFLKYCLYQDIAGESGRQRRKRQPRSSCRLPHLQIPSLPPMLLLHPERPGRQEG
jgi:hypothetical protein